MTKRIIFLGPPGAGKGTQAEILAKISRIPHISTGEILRQAIAEQTPLGQKAQAYVDQGNLVPDELILDLIRERLQAADAKDGWILDGFPRNVNQAQFLDKLLQDLDQAYDYVLNLEVPDRVLIERLLERGRQDDNQEIISHRLEVYRQQTAPVIDYYHSHGNFQSVKGDLLLEEVTQSLQAIITV